MNKIKIMFLMPFLGGGGTERVISLLCNNLDPEKFDVTLTLVKKEGRYIDNVSDHVKIITIDKPRVRNAIFDIVKLVNSERPDILFSSLGEFNLVVSMIKCFFNKYTVVITRESNTVSSANKDKSYPALYNFLYKTVYKNLDNIICQCHFMERDLIENYGIDKNSIKVINNPVDVKYICGITENSERSLSQIQDKLRIVVAGRLENQKGFDLLLRALSRVKRKYELIILGDGTKKEELEDLASKLNISDKVKFKGTVSNPFFYFKNSDVYILSSRYEGFPNVVLEACIIGLPIIAYNSPGGTADIINSNIIGDLVTYGECEEINIECLAESIEKFDSGHYKSDEIINDITNRFGVDKIIEEYSRYFFSLVESRVV
ncbi:glycosyltransferase [Vibrio renipiscarius]|uniref:Glycosyl transferase family 1 domain-containing protein n=1 Tax=Vibrio renipiscarius TaxID=1461322 RepID=A0A0C2NZR9_9VIBR|nr:glycosyltransferase [Vibrio renipiscarius]KII77750.1 hypothetical protein OJ16_11120 [Vibrio renipiscarius]KII81575.1 hypothetical protein PL18_03120 [Vibrio renipiscarius]